MSIIDPTLSAARIQRLVNAMRDLNSNPDPVGSVNKYTAVMRELYGDEGLISVTTRGLAPGEYRVMRFLHQDGVARKGFVDTFFAGADAPVRRGGYLGEIVVGGEAVVRRDLHVPYDPVLEDALAPYRLIIATPVYGLGPMSNWVMFLNTNPEAYNQFEIESRVQQANLMSGITTSKRARADLEEATRQIQQEIDEIASIMNGLIPEVLPHVPGLELAASFETFDRAGGDYYDVFPLTADPDAPCHRWGIMIADASGHGASAAVIIAMLSALLHSVSDPEIAPGAVLEHLNQHLLRRQRTTFFVTVVFGIYDTQTRHFDYCSAGHPPPILLGEGAADRSPGPGGGLPLGIDARARYTSQRIALQSGDTLVLYTDGVTEAMGPADELFGDARFHQVVSEADPTPETLIATVKDALRIHQRGERPKDDQTMLVFRVEE